MNGLRIRSVARADVAACARIFREVLREIEPDRASSRMHRSAFLNETRGELVLVAELDGRVVGFVSIARKEAFIHFLLIDPDARGKGVGTALLEAIFVQLDGPVELKCRPTNLAAQAFYDTRGWRVVERRDDTYPPFIRYRHDGRPV